MKKIITDIIFTIYPLLAGMSLAQGEYKKALIFSVITVFIITYSNLKDAKFEILQNKLDEKRWYEAGICYDPNNIFEYKKVIAIAFVFFTIYIRFDKIKNN